MWGKELKDKSLVAVKVYNKIAEKYAKAFPKPSSSIDMFISLLPKGGKVLDVGCGPGQDSGYLFRREFDVEGIDLSEKMIEQARKKVPEVKFVVMDMRKLRYPNSYFDGLFASLSLIHIPKKDVDKTMNEFKRVLKEGGSLYLHLLEGNGEQMLLEPLDPKALTFLNLFSLEEVKSLLAKFMFKPQVISRTTAKGSGEFNHNKLLIIAKKEENRS